MPGFPDMVLAPPLDVGVVDKMRPVYAGFWVGGKRVCYQIPQTCMDDKDGRIWSEQEVCIGAIGLKGRFGADEDGQNDGWLEGEGRSANMTVISRLNMCGTAAP